MSIYKTYRHIESEGTINGNRYALEVYCTWYIPYNSLNNGKKNYASVSETNLADHILKHTPTYLCGSKHTDQFGNEWYEKAWMGDYLYVAVKNGERMFTEPTSYYNACQIISKDANLPYDDKYSHYEYCYNKMHKLHEKFDSSKGEYVPNYADLFKRRFNVGDRVFYLVHKDSDTRNGERYQVESFIIEKAEFDGDHWSYDNGGTTCLSHKSVTEKSAFKSVEDIIKVYGTDIWMWHHNGGCYIEKCLSTAYFMRYIDQQED